MYTKFYSMIEEHKEIVEPVVEAILNTRSSNDVMYIVLDELKEMYKNYIGNVVMRNTDGRVHYYLKRQTWMNGKREITSNEIAYYWYE